MVRKLKEWWVSTPVGAAILHARDTLSRIILSLLLRFFDSISALFDKSPVLTVLCFNKPKNEETKNDAAITTSR